MEAFGVSEPVNVVVEATHTIGVPVIVGKVYTVTVSVIVHPFTSVYLITLVPAETPVTTPELFTVATLGVSDVHGFVALGVPEPVNEAVKPTHTDGAPVIVGKGAIVIVFESSL